MCKEKGAKEEEGEAETRERNGSENPRTRGERKPEDAEGADTRERNEEKGQRHKGQ